MKRKRRRVVITGIGVISAGAIGKENFNNALFNGQSGISKISSFDTKDFRCHYGGEVKNFNPKDFIKQRGKIPLGRASQFAVAASSMAIEDAKINSFKDRTSVALGITMGEPFLQNIIEAWFRKNINKIPKNFISHAPVNVIATNIARYFGICGENQVLSTACSAGNYAIAYGTDLIKNGDIDFVLAGGVDYFSRVAFCGFHRLYAMASKKCCPFDKHRDGLLLGEGAGILFLESMGSAIKRNAKIYAEVLGYGLSCDAFHPAASTKEGMEKAMQKALVNSGVLPKDVDYICAHGTGTVNNDKNECAAIKSIFGGRYKKIPVSSIKSMLGHAMSAASSIGAIACCLAIKHNFIPPTINFRNRDQDCDIDCVPNKARRKKIDIILNNGFAFGGNNCCIILKRVV